MSYRSGYSTRTKREAFEANVSKQENGCWLWTGAVSKKRGGYGAFTHRPSGVHQQRAHRASFEIYNDVVLKEEEHVLHTCDTPSCVNPAHLFKGDQAKNMADKVTKGRQNKGVGHGMHKLQPEHVLAIRQDSRKQAVIAAHYGVTVSTVSSIQNRTSWTHI